MAVVELLARVNFPPYSVRMLTPRHVIVAGGGGNAKTGIGNAIEIYELSFNGKKCCARPASRYETGESACMNLAAWYNGKYHVLAAGLDGDCQVYQVKYKVIHPEEEGEVLKEVNSKLEYTRSTSVRKRRQSECEPTIKEPNWDEPPPLPNSAASMPSARRRSTARKLSSSSSTTTSAPKPDTNSNSVLTMVGFEFRPLQRFQTDFPLKVEPYQKVTCLSPDFSFLVTGGSDGHVRLWKYPDFNLILNIEAHKDDVDDIDVHPQCNRIVSVSRDGHAFIWNTQDGKLICELKWIPVNDQKYRCRNCRFGITEGDKSRSKLFTSHVPIVNQKSKASKGYPACFLIKWDTTKYVPEKVQPVGKDLSAMTVSDDGRFVGVGTMSGTVSIYISFSLQRIYNMPKTHNIFVTGLEFLPSNEETRLVVGERDTSLISISVDNQIQIHHIPKQATISVTLFLISMFAILFLTFTLLTYVGF